jgi:hypothetical protein
MVIVVGQERVCGKARAPTQQACSQRKACLSQSVTSCVCQPLAHISAWLRQQPPCIGAGDCYRADHLLEGHLEALLEDKKNPLTPEQRKVRWYPCTVAVNA